MRWVGPGAGCRPHNKARRCQPAGAPCCSPARAPASPPLTQQADVDAAALPLLLAAGARQAGALAARQVHQHQPRPHALRAAARQLALEPNLKRGRARWAGCIVWRGARAACQQQQCCRRAGNTIAPSSPHLRDEDGVRARGARVAVGAVGVAQEGGGQQLALRGRAVEETGVGAGQSVERARAWGVCVHVSQRRHLRQQHCIALTCRSSGPVASCQVACGREARVSCSWRLAGRRLLLATPLLP